MNVVAQVAAALKTSSQLRAALTVLPTLEKDILKFSVPPKTNLRPVPQNIY